ncbi:DNA-binding SAP [Penicillium expansum]|uniref:DNA-binding SAP n=1 Tax=Penicillium expansum TaxID=27334 RepID=A0A0A2IN54_PENEN|nr:DNA-binding SAP [Penicillium expansum]KGO44517.1 DNA-binding SAP [Penicillium expansum]KGO55331.1 DNA-binding SAP [Penicillium expansum]KGO56807.1 DNA-binding SAP [Penicillium expansum]
MSDYSSLKVADLKAECKKRGIPQTGLRLKQHFIDKLVELDSQTNQDTDEAAAPAEESTESQPSAPDAVTQEKSQPEQPENEQLEQPRENSISQPEETTAIVSVSDQIQDGQIQADESAQDEAVSAADVKSQKVEEVAKPVEEAQTETTAPGNQDPAAVPDQPPMDEAAQVAKNEEPIKPQEKSISTAQISEVDTGKSTPLPVEEALEDTRKRKRRSQSPAPTLEEIANRKARAKETTPRVLLKNDEGLSDLKSEGQKATEEHTDKQPIETQADSHKTPTKQDARFRNLFPPAGASSQPASPPRDITMQDADITPALHAATSALYIDGLMRPLQPTALRKHLASLASTPETSDSDAIIDFYLDAIKTHCFVSFTSPAAASRVRSAVHGTVWPNERNRKNLRADFIPDEKIKEWIETEEKSRDRAGAAARWEVRYETSDDGTTATLAEVGSAPSGRRESGFNRTPPLGPRRDIEHFGRRPSNAPLAVPAPPSRPGQGFKPLDELFESTTTKPKLYYLPVPRPVADKRLDQFDELIQKGTFPRRGGDEMRRITFEGDDKFVDIGPERFGPGPRSGPGRGRGRGGRRGDSWRS